MSADDGDDNDYNDDDSNRPGCLTVLMIGVLIGSLAGLLNT